MSRERDVVEGFDLGGAVMNVAPLGRGLINDTFLVTTDRGHAVLQRINRRAFPQPQLIIQNLRVLSDYLAARDGSADALRIPSILTTRAGQDFVLDQDGGFWRALSYIENTLTCYTIANRRQAEQVGGALGRFHVMMSGLDPQRLRATRPNFHNTPEYFARFAHAAAASPQRDGAELAWCLGFAEQRRASVMVLESAKRSGQLALRIIHGDPKLDNFLFDTGGARIVSVIDLDTVQPGLFHYDVGDCLRSCANPAGESPAKLDDVHFDLDICRAILTPYLDVTRGLLTAQDYAHLYDAIRLIPFELGLRFLTDHLEGDVYFKIERPGHNLHRAQAQFRLTADIEKKESAIRGLIAQMS